MASEYCCNIIAIFKAPNDFFYMLIKSLLFEDAKSLNLVIKHTEVYLQTFVLFGIVKMNKLYRIKLQIISIFTD